jgi:hypothetical protein
VCSLRRTVGSASVSSSSRAKTASMDSLSCSVLINPLIGYSKPLSWPRDFCMRALVGRLRWIDLPSASNENFSPTNH